MTPAEIAILPTITLAIAFLTGGLAFSRWMLNAFIMTTAGGGILYLIFQDIAPQAKLQRH